MTFNPCGGNPYNSDGPSELNLLESRTLHRISRDLDDCEIELIPMRWALQRGSSCIIQPVDKSTVDRALQVLGIELIPRHMRMISALGHMHERFILGVDPWISEGISTHPAELWDEVPVDALGVPLSGSVLGHVSQFNDIDEHGAGLSFREPNGQYEAFAIRDAAGNIHCYLNKCPHVGVPLDFMPGQFLSRDCTQIVCSTHGARFRKDTGLCTEGPCTGKFLQEFPVHVNEDGFIVADQVNQYRFPTPRKSKYIQ